MLGQIARDAREEGKRVYALAFHVDYWDYLGWTDPFGDEAYSNHQRAYARAWKSRRIYTPQMIVNGAKENEFVGSDQRRASKSISRTLEQAAEVGLHLRGDGDGDGILVRYKVEASPQNAMLNVALVERGLATDVPGGANAGLRLMHENVVRAFERVAVAPEGQGEVRLRLRADVQIGKASVIGYVQDGASMEILGAALIDLTPNESGD